MVNELRKRLFNTTVYTELQVCFTFSKYENDTLSLCETTNVFIDSDLLFQIHFHRLGPFKLIKNIFLIFKYFMRFISSVESLSKG